MYHRIDGVWHQLLGKVADCSSPLKACVPLRKLHPLLSQVPVGEPPWRSSLRVELRSTHQALVHLVRVGRCEEICSGPEADLCPHEDVQEPLASRTGGRNPLPCARPGKAGDSRFRGFRGKASLGFTMGTHFT